MSWVRVPPEAADFSQKKSLPQVSVELCCVSLFMFGRCLEVCLSCTLYMYIHDIYFTACVQYVHIEQRVNCIFAQLTFYMYMYMYIHRP